MCSRISANTWRIETASSNKSFLLSLEGFISPPFSLQVEGRLGYVTFMSSRCILNVRWPVRTSLRKPGLSRFLVINFCHYCLISSLFGILCVHSLRLPRSVTPKAFYSQTGSKSEEFVKIRFKASACTWIRKAFLMPMPSGYRSNCKLSDSPSPCHFYRCGTDRMTYFYLEDRCVFSQSAHLGFWWCMPSPEDCLKKVLWESTSYLALDDPLPRLSCRYKRH